MRVENSVPEDLIMDIFAKLPVKSLIGFMCLSKSCCQAISDPQFFRLQLHHSNQINKQFLLRISRSPLTLQSFSVCHHQSLRESVTFELQITLPSRSWWDVVSSCNGVVCLRTFPEAIHYIGILNPSIKKLKLVPFPNLEDSFYPSNGRYRSVDGADISAEIGFGFDSRTSDFKIVIIFREICSERWRQVQVYSLRQNSWKVLSNVPNSLYNIYNHRVVVNGAFYWYVKSVISDCHLILMFDFTDETFKEIKFPDCYYEDREDLGGPVRFGEVKGKLSLLLLFYLNEDPSVGDSLEMWMMEDSGWVRQFVVNLRQFYSPQCLAMGDEVMLMATYSKFGIFSCDFKTLELTAYAVEGHGIPAFTYTPSLALLGQEN